MKVYLKATNNIRRRYVQSLENQICEYLGIPDAQGSPWKLSMISNNKFNFRLSRRYDRLDANSKFTSYDDDTIKQQLQSRGAKYITFRYGECYFNFDYSGLEREYNEDKSRADSEYKTALYAVDISNYIPDEKTIDKLLAYRNKGAKVNCKAIKDINKLLTYYYAGRLIGWDDLCEWCCDNSMYLDHNYDDQFKAINIQVQPSEEYSDTRGEVEQRYNLPKSDLFKFDTNRLWVPRKLIDYFIKSNIPVEFKGRRPGGEFDRNGVQWTEIEQLILYPDTYKLPYDIAVHTLESGGTTTYSGLRDRKYPVTPERTSIANVIKDIEYYLSSKGVSDYNL